MPQLHRHCRSSLHGLSQLIIFSFWRLLRILLPGLSSISWSGRPSSGGNITVHLTTGILSSRFTVRIAGAGAAGRPPSASTVRSQLKHSVRTPPTSTIASPGSRSTPLSAALPPSTSPATSVRPTPVTASPPYSSSRMPSPGDSAVRGISTSISLVPHAPSVGASSSLGLPSSSILSTFQPGAMASAVLPSSRAVFRAGCGASPSASARGRADSAAATSALSAAACAESASALSASSSGEYDVRSSEGRWSQA
mmetsp:Transcript_22877/g.53057  ORF Transcript_22877/g.53057 Transcript_22877/m.53057 type:complete len:253 (-) Transcript_22877:130-888(-)